jgi:hypothetical protein
LEIPTIATSLVASGAVARVLVPTNGALGSTWTAASFNDAGWMSVAKPVNYTVGVTATSVLAIDVNDRSTAASGVTQTGFSSFVINSNISSTAIQTQATVRVFSGVTVTVSNTPPYGYDDRLRTRPVNSSAFTESLLLRDFFYSMDGSGTGALNINLAGLTANAAHRVTVWSFDGQSSGNKVSDWYANGALVKDNYTFNSSTTPTSNEQYRFMFSATASGSGTMLVSGRRVATSSSTGVYLNALKVERLTTQAATNALGRLMQSNNATAYIRLPFTVSNPSTFESLRLRVRYNDGFVASINGTVVASRNAPSTPQWNSTATASVPGAAGSTNEDIVISNGSGLLASGMNVLAIQGLNVSAVDTNFFILPELDGLASGTAVERYFTPPTPGTNNGTGYLGLVSDTKFSVDRGFYDTPFTVAITSATATASIYWTTNGSVPSPTNGMLYTSPVLISGTRMLRATACLAEHVPSVPDTHTYIFIQQVLLQSSNQPGYPANWQGSYPADYGMDPTVVNHTNYGLTISNDLRSMPTLSIVGAHESFWDATTGIYVDPTVDRGERAVSAELIGGGGASKFQINCGVQMHGQAGRDNTRCAKHSLRLEFKGDYGPSRLSHDWFGGGVSDFDGIILRASWADSWATRFDPYSGGSYPWADDYPLRYRPETATYLRDAWVRQAMQDLGHPASRSSFVHLYINGLYWGLYNPIERLDTSFFAGTQGGLEKDWDIVKDRDDMNAQWPELQDGSLMDWTNLIARVNAGITDEASFQAVAALVDVDNLIDYMMLHAVVEANDWLQDSNPHNWFAAHRRANSTNGLPATKWIFLPWDQEISMVRTRTEDRVNVSVDKMPSRIYSQLRNCPEFRRMFGDHVQKHLFNTGALAPTNNILRLQALAARISSALVGESARWGDAREFSIGVNSGTGLTFTRDEWWLRELDAYYTNWYPNVMNQRAIVRFQAAGLYPTVGAPQFSQFGGAISNGFSLVLSHTNATGAILFSVDGSDPRVYGTGVTSPGAQSYETPIPFNGPTVVRARVLSGGQWSALVETVFYPPQDLSRLCLNEIMYHPPDMGTNSGSDLEFLELKNQGTNTLDLSGLKFTSGITFTFTNGTRLAPGAFFVLARNAAAFARKYPGVAVQGTYAGQLDNSGEQLTLSHPAGGVIFSMTYGDRAPWPVAPDLASFSLVPVNPGASQAPDKGSKWRASTCPGGSPGADDPAPVVPSVLIDEILTHTDLPALEFIELFNPAGSNVNIGGWFLTDEADVMKYRIPDGTLIPAGGRIILEEDRFNADPTNGFKLNSAGDDVYLFSADAAGNLTGYNHGVSFGGAYNGVSFGRHVNSAGEESYPQQLTLTPREPNSGPRIGPVVISEIHYHPGAGDDEFVELLNLTSNAVPLFNPAHPTNMWRIGGIGFEFPANVTLGANGMLLVVSTNPAMFRAKYDVPTNVAVFGPFTGQLDNAGENLELQAPDDPNLDNVPCITMDVVRYGDKAPWPAAADGAGMSLQRSPASGYGSEPASWISAAPTPGRPVGASDTDHDGLPDWWELAFGTNPNVDDAAADPDHDGLTNAQEYLAGSRPFDPESRLQFGQATTQGGSVRLQFHAGSNCTYSVLYKTSFEDSQWTKLLVIPSCGTSGIVTITNVVPGGGTRFYRLVAPAIP